MGTSVTVNVILIAEDGLLQTAQTKLEICQEIKKYANRWNNPIKEMYAQTETGRKMIGALHTFESIDISNFISRNTISCICKKSNGCFICNYSGVTTQKHINGFQDWQIENSIKEE